MAGIYIHIPFCKQACYYCDFHFSTSLKNKEAFIEALLKEIELRKNYLQSEKINTIYLGGGTPSLLTKDELMKIFDSLFKHFNIDTEPEITLEANPDDLNLEKIKQLIETPINRLSIGLQSFYDEDLKFMNRAHNSSEALRVVQTSQDNGFENITIDLIYGIQTLSNEKWKKNLHTAFGLEVKHISAYCLTVEENTALAHKIKTRQIVDINEQQGAEQFEIMLEEMQKNNFAQYEISNFCKDNYFSKHNSNYWLKENYLGLGPSAHSYNGISRQWNVSNNAQYIQSLFQKKLNFEKEKLTTTQRYNEYILTSLRTMWGTDLAFVENNFGNNYLTHCLKETTKHKDTQKIIINENKIYLTDEGKLIADKIASDLFFID